MVKKVSNQNGFVLPMVLVLTSLLFPLFLTGIDVLGKGERMSEKDFGHLVLNYRVEGGLYLAVDQMRQGVPLRVEQVFVVNGTPIKVTLRSNGDEIMELFGYGEMPPDFASGIAILVNKKTGKIVEWRDGG